MRRVLITQIGFVAKVEHAPAVIDAHIRANHLFSANRQRHEYWTTNNADRTHLGVIILPGTVIDGHVYRPSWQVTQQHRTETSIHTANSILFPNDMRSIQHST